MREDAASLLIDATPDDVHAAFTDADALLAWLPPEGMRGRFERFDPERGYRMVLTYLDPPDGGGKASADSDIADVRRTSVEPGRIVEEVDFPSEDPAYAGTMTMTWTFQPRGGSTLVTVSATDVPPGIDQDVHVEALESSLAQLAAHLGR